MTISFEELKAVFAYPAVETAMRAVVTGRRVMPSTLVPPWLYLGRSIPVGPFRLFRASIELALRNALRDAKDKDRERLLILLRLTDLEDPESRISAVGQACEEYAVFAQFGTASLPSWRAFNGR